MPGTLTDVLRKTVTVERQGHVARVAWSRPPVNVLDGEALRELAAVLRSPEVTGAKAVVLQGRGRCWSAGLSVADHLKGSVDGMLDDFHAALRALWDVPVPTVGQVHGACLGGGLELLLMCDLSWAAHSATFGQPEIRLGVFPPLAAAWLPALTGAPRAAHINFLGDTMGATDAERAGLVGQVVPETELEEAVGRAVAQLSSSRRAALVHLKAAMRAAAPDPWPGIAAAEKIYRERLMAGPDAEEGLRAFLEKRTPQWTEEA